jgi:hypothetical protein
LRAYHRVQAEELHGGRKRKETKKSDKCVPFERVLSVDFRCGMALSEDLIEALRIREQGKCEVRSWTWGLQNCDVQSLVAAVTLGGLNICCIPWVVNR